jgi:hypothetical protein
MVRRYIRPPRLREALLGGLLFVALVLGAWMDRGSLSSDTASLLTSETSTPASETNSPQTADHVDGVAYTENAGGGGAKNIVRLVNKQDSRLRIKGNIQLNRIPGPTAAPGNVAFSYGSCSDCQTLTVALQINLISRSASVVTPENGAVALNYQCTRCLTAAWALQYVISVDDPTQVPPDVSELIKAMDRELNALHADNTVTLEQAMSRIEAIIAQFTTLADSLKEQRSERSDTTTPGATELP